MQLNKIIDYLNTISNITDLVWDRIYWWIPKDEPTENYITLNIITEAQPLSVEKFNRIEFRYIGWDTATTYQDLQNIDEQVLIALNNYKADWVYKIVITNFVNGYDNKQKRVLIRDVLIYYTV